MTHLQAVAERARVFGSAFGAGELAYAAGICHDLGKFHPDFQTYLRWCDEHPGQRGSRVDHKAAGARYSSPISPLLPLLIMAHHGGLKSPTDLRASLADPALTARVEAALVIAEKAFPSLPAQSAQPLPDLPRTSAELFSRMLFSCLVDADFLDTEAHFDPTRAISRGVAFDPKSMLDALRQELARLNEGRDDDITRLRIETSTSCEAAGDSPPGIYRMTVPTGGGKTLSGMAFALRHALRHGKQRIIVAIPYTSITEQTAGVYRALFGEHNVLEHHSAVKPRESDGDEPTALHSWQRLAAENWDAPVVVTTMVQLFESLLGNRVSTSRKLHHICGSVLILDETQMLPPRYLTPILDVLKDLVGRFEVTVLLSTATQPDYSHAEIQGVEIAPDPRRSFKLASRVRYEFEPEAWSWQDAANRLALSHQGLMVLNTKSDARSVLDALPGADTLHLSTNLCGAHRQRVLADVKRRLAAGQRCLLVSTQVVEAGVDLDFPVVFRAMGPLDRIIQAAGRCNREGRLPYGTVTVFNPSEGGLPPGVYRTATQLTGIDLARRIDLDDPYALAPWFQRLFGTVDTDAGDIQALRERMNYPEVARRFRMIDDDTEDVVVPYGDPHERDVVASAEERLRGASGSARHLLRQLQPFTVGLRNRDLRRAQGRGFVEPLIEGVWQWTGPEDFYDPIRGLVVEGSDEELLIA